MRIFILLAVAISHLMIAPAQAKDLPNGEYVVLGDDLLPGIQNGFIVPVFVHLKTRQDQMEWTFISNFLPDKMMCEAQGKCKRAVPALGHRVTWQDDGTLEVHSLDRRTGPGMTIERPETDLIHVITPIEDLISKGVLTLTEEGGTLTMARRGKPRKHVDLVPIALPDLIDAIAFIRGFELSLAKLNQCGIRQIVTIMAESDRTAVQQQVVDTAKFMGRRDRLDADARYYGFDEPPEAKRAEIERKRMLSSLMSMAMAVQKELSDAATEGGRVLTDAEILAKVEDFVTPCKKRAKDAYPAMVEEIVRKHPDQLLAALKLSMRFERLIANGYDPYTFVCEDITLMQ